MLFVPLTYTLASEDAERIGIDHVARLSKIDTGENSIGNFTNRLSLHIIDKLNCLLASENMMAHYGAIKMLFTRVKLVLDYVNGVQSG